MNILLVELNPNEVLTDESLFPDKNKDILIYEHLKHYCSKFYPLPTIEIKVYAESVIVVRGHSYLKIAKELRHQSIRAVIDRNSPKPFVDSFLQKSSVVQLDWELIKQEEDNNLVSYVWLVFFFERQLEKEEQKIFEEQIIEFYRQIKLPAWADTPDNRIKDLSYPHFGCCVEFQAYIPVEDERWYAKSRAALVNFHLNHVPLVSFQGYKFQI